MLADIGERVGARDAEELTLQQAAHAQAPARPRQNSECSKRRLRASTTNSTVRRWAPSAIADADFAGALADEEREHAVDSDQRQHEGDTSEYGKEIHVEPSPGHEAGHASDISCTSWMGSSLTNDWNGGAYGRECCRRIHARAHDDEAFWRGKLPQRQ